MADVTADLEWSVERRELTRWAEPLLQSPAMKRLSNVTFLGGLARRFGSRVRRDDGNRYDHSIGVSWLALRAAERLSLPDASKRLAVAWGLTHDIATWALSHTSEPAFSASTSTDQRTLRRLIVTGARCLSGAVVIAQAIREMGVMTADLLALFAKDRAPIDRHHAMLWHVINSPLSPDGLEGIWRAGYASKTAVPNPRALIESLDRNLLDEPYVSAAGLRGMTAFWRAKAHIYREFINDDRSRWFESHWAHRIRSSFRKLDLVRSLEITETELVQNAPPPRGEQLSFKWGELRFREPQKYTVEKINHHAAMPLCGLSAHLRRQPARES